MKRSRLPAQILLLCLLILFNGLILSVASQNSQSWVELTPAWASSTGTVEIASATAIGVTKSPFETEEPIDKTVPTQTEYFVDEDVAEMGANKKSEESTPTEESVPSAPSTQSQADESTSTSVGDAESTVTVIIPTQTNSEGTLTATDTSVNRSASTLEAAPTVSTVPATQQKSGLQLVPADSSTPTLSLTTQAYSTYVGTTAVPTAAAGSIPFDQNATASAQPWLIVAIIVGGSGLLTAIVVTAFFCFRNRNRNPSVVSSRLSKSHSWQRMPDEPQAIPHSIRNSGLASFMSRRPQRFSRSDSNSSLGSDMIKAPDPAELSKIDYFSRRPAQFQPDGPFNTNDSMILAGSLLGDTGSFGSLLRTTSKSKSTNSSNRDSSDSGLAGANDFAIRSNMGNSNSSGQLMSPRFYDDAPKSQEGSRKGSKGSSIPPSIPSQTSNRRSHLSMESRGSAQSVPGKSAHTSERGESSSRVDSGVTSGRNVNQATGAGVWTGFGLMLSSTETTRFDSVDDEKGVWARTLNRRQSDAGMESPPGTMLPGGYDGVSQPSTLLSLPTDVLIQGIPAEQSVKMTGPSHIHERVGPTGATISTTRTETTIKIERPSEWAGTNIASGSRHSASSLMFRDGDSRPVSEAFSRMTSESMGNSASVFATSLSRQLHEQLDGANSSQNSAAGATPTNRSLRGSLTQSMRPRESDVAPAIRERSHSIYTQSEIVSVASDDMFGTDNPGRRDTRFSYESSVAVLPSPNAGSPDDTVANRLMSMIRVLDVERMVPTPVLGESGVPSRVPSVVRTTDPDSELSPSSFKDR